MQSSLGELISRLTKSAKFIVSLPHSAERINFMDFKELADDQQKLIDPIVPRKARKDRSVAYDKRAVNAVAYVPY